jgi:uncharacterized C2H2 Zn-finger protein
MPPIEDVAHFSKSRSKGRRVRTVRVTPEELGKGRGYDFPVEVRHVEPKPEEVGATTDEIQEPLDVDVFSDTVANLFRCDFPGCPRAFESRRSLSYHKSHSHLAGQEDPGRGSIRIRVPGYRPPTSTVQADGTIKCSECGYVSADDKSMSSHKRSHYTEARAQYVRELEVAAAEVGGLRRALREAQNKLNNNNNNGPSDAPTKPQPESDQPISVAGMTTNAPLTIEGAVDFIMEEVTRGDERMLELERENRRLSDLVDTLQKDDQGEAIATIDLIKEAFRKFQHSDLTMMRFLSEVEDALALIDPSINDDDDE